MDGQAGGLGLNDIVEEFQSLAARHWKLLVLVVLAIAAGYSLLDLAATELSNFASIVVQLPVQYAVTERLLADRIELGKAGQGRRYGALFAASLLGGVAITVGVLLLVLPGLILFARLSLSTPFIVVERRSGYDALETSWRATAPARWLLVGVWVFYLLAMAAGIMLLASLGEIGEVGDRLASGDILLNLFTAGISVVGWVLAAAVYCRVVPDQAKIVTVFE